MSLYDIARACYYDPGYVWEHYGKPTAWIFGNEAHGVSPEMLELADEVVALPIFGEAESLNLATAASVCLYASAFEMQGNR